MVSARPTALVCSLLLDGWSGPIRFPLPPSLGWPPGQSSRPQLESLSHRLQRCFRSGILLSYFFRLWFGERNQHINDFFPQKPLNNSFWRVFAFLLAVWVWSRRGQRAEDTQRQGCALEADGWPCLPPVLGVRCTWGPVARVSTPALGCGCPWRTVRSDPSSNLVSQHLPSSHPLHLLVPEAFNQTGLGTESLLPAS